MSNNERHTIYFPVDPHRLCGTTLATHSVVFDLNQKSQGDKTRIAVTVYEWIEAKSKWAPVEGHKWADLKRSAIHWEWLPDPFDQGETRITFIVYATTARLMWKKMRAVGWDYLERKGWNT